MSKHGSLQIGLLTPRYAMCENKGGGISTLPPPLPREGGLRTNTVLVRYERELSGNIKFYSVMLIELFLFK